MGANERTMTRFHVSGSVHSMLDTCSRAAMYNYTVDFLDKVRGNHESSAQSLKSRSPVRSGSVTACRATANSVETEDGLLIRSIARLTLADPMSQDARDSIPHSGRMHRVTATRARTMGCLLDRVFIQRAVISRGLLHTWGIE